MRSLVGVCAVLMGLSAMGGCKDKRREVPRVAVEPIEPTAGEGPGALHIDESNGAMPLQQTGPTLEVEPNDTQAQATPLPINGGLRAALRAGVEGAEDEDWFVLTLTDNTPQQVRIQLTPDGAMDFALQWMPEAPPGRPRRVPKGWDAEGKLATIDATGPGGVEVLAPALLQPGRHWFRVKQMHSKKHRRRRVEGDGDYRITTTVVDPDGNLEEEPNNTRETANILRPGESRTGYLGWFRDSDWFRLDLDGQSDGAIVRVDVTGVPGVKSRLWVVNGKRRGLVKVPEAKLAWPTGRPLTARDLGWNRSAGPYFAEVRSMRASNSNDRYTITMTVEPAEATTAREREPNWRPAFATPLTADAPLDGFIGHPTDWDVYRIDAEEPMLGTVIVSGIPSVDLKLELINHSRQVTVTLDEAGPGEAETLPLIPVGPDPAFVRLSSKGHGFNVDQGYRIALSLREAGDREIEPNDDFKGARRVVLPIGRPFLGTIHPRGDLDHFGLDIPPQEGGEEKVLTIRLTGAEGMTLAMYLYDNDRALITKRGGIDVGETRTITHGFTPGRYTIRVKDESGQNANANSNYTIQVTE